MGIVNDIAKAFADLLMGVLGWMHPVLLILAVALLTAAGSLLVFKVTSNQPAIRRAKGKVTAHLLALVLFRHDLRLLFKSLGLALLGTLANLRFMLLPLLVMIVPLVVLFVQLDHRLGIRGLEVGETSVVRVAVPEETDLSGIGLAASGGAVVETPGVRVTDPSRGLREVDFRIRAVKAGKHELEVRRGSSEGTPKRVSVGPGLGLKSPRRVSGGLLDRLFYPAEDALPSGLGVTFVEISYPAALYGFLGIEWAWWTLFLLFMILGLFLLRGPLRVHF